MNNYELEKVAGIFNNIKKAQRKAKMKQALKKFGKRALIAGGIGAGISGAGTLASIHVANKIGKGFKAMGNDFRNAGRNMKDRWQAAGERMKNIRDARRAAKAEKAARKAAKGI